MTKVVGLISNDDNSTYREEVNQLIVWCDNNNLSLNVNKTKEIVVDFRRRHLAQTPLVIHKHQVPGGAYHGRSVMDYKHHISCTAEPSFIRQMRRVNLLPPVLITFYRGTIEGILTSSLSVWYGSCTVLDPTVSSENGVENHQNHLRSVLVTLPKESHQDSQRPHPPNP